MQYAFLLRPHANPRYLASLQALAEAELALLLAAQQIETGLAWEEMGGAPWLCFECEPLSDEVWRLLSLHASSYVLAKREGEALIPLARQHPAYIGEDLAALLKYKGKTNELFTDTLLNLALASSDFAARSNEPLHVLDPLCGRGTTLFLALRRGWHAAGTDADKTEIKELNGFFTRYLEYHRLKHKRMESALTVGGKLGGRLTKYEFADTPEHFKAGDVRCLRVICGDTRNAPALLGSSAHHLLVADLPYGVQHTPTNAQGGRSRSIESLMREALPAWLKALKPGGAAALSFNTHVTPRSKVAAWMGEAGFQVCEGGYYERLAHWVEQAVNRDVAVGRKRA
ncbi:MAG: SAM-dependent methyltransferase [Clostridia bacterium]|nr:SAM-dependent methyltransferase [Clostridia bacterium]